MQKIWLNKKININKYRILATVSPKYKSKLTLKEIDPHIWSILNHTVISNDSKYLFVKNSKAACSTVAHAIYQWQYKTAYDGNIHETQQLLQGFRHTSLVVGALKNTQVFKFSFVRNPTKRVTSAFNNFFVDFKNKQHKKHMPFMERLGFSSENSTERNFDIFMQYLEVSFEADMDRIDPHFRPQFYNVRPDLISYDFLGRVENLDSDLKTIMGKLNAHGLNLEIQKTPRKNVSQGGYIPTKVQVQKLEELFSKDYEIFE